MGCCLLLSGFFLAISQAVDCAGLALVLSGPVEQAVPWGLAAGLAVPWCLAAGTVRTWAWPWVADPAADLVGGTVVGLLKSMYSGSLGIWHDEYII